MGEGYRRWLEAHPDATKEEQEKAWDDYIKKLEARRLAIEMLMTLRY